MALSGVVSLQKYALGGRPPGPFFRNLPIAIPAAFLLNAVRVGPFALSAEQIANFQLNALSGATFDLEV